MRFLTAIATIAALGYASLYALATFVTPRARDMSVTIPAQKLRPQPVEAASKNPKTAGAETSAGAAATP
ncbi:hypothetical protein [Chenggangzhangella methanolivorans]|uniref:Histidine kinase n=2 Tax=Chenggangzhangella methanolivorans TaxID=1437009 RepID=A0A9E6RED5_9HYPH|nr:hypothetical protein [Chenggangzhangella methanolivorans]QZO01963.1 hypothetical protein K6K41_12000 [Chenggangzhangella methanolivorans]